MNATLRIEEDKIVKTTVEEFDRYVDWDDIKGYIEGDDWTGEAPWEHCDGWEHTFDKDTIGIMTTSATITVMSIVVVVREVRAISTLTMMTL